MFTILINVVDNIEKDFDKLFENIQTPAENLIVIAHCPPNDTHLDLMKGHVHVGSIGIHRVLQKRQPLLTFHGHIHETVDLSKRFHQKINKTNSYSSGNIYKREVHYVLVDTAKPNEGVRRNAAQITEPDDPS